MYNMRYFQLKCSEPARENGSHMNLKQMIKKGLNLKNLSMTFLLCVFVMLSSQVFADLSAEPLQTLPPVSNRTLPEGQLVFVDPLNGQDNATGSETKPLRTIAQALRLVQPGGTICLRGGTYYEQVYIARQGREDAPITLRGYPGERAIIDGGIAAFYQTPQDAWRPVSSPQGAKDEYESVQTFPNLYRPIGSFGDSMIGLQTYYHAIDLRADQQLVHYADPAKRREVDHDPLYCGPGVWHNPQTGRIHIRLAHTNVDGMTNYTGPTDPRQLPMVIAPFRSVPLVLDGVKHVVLQDLVIRGGGYDTVKLNLAEHVVFDNVVIWAGTYGIRAQSTRHLRIVNSAVHGNIPPWSFRSDTSKRDYPGRPHRNITRLNTHALLVTDSGREFSVYATPVNDHWELAYNLWTDAHDGVYLGAINIRFHNNILENMQDDGVYLSPMYPRHRFTRSWVKAYVYENLFRQVNMPIAFGGLDRDAKMGDVAYIYRNIFDQRFPLMYGRPRTQNPSINFWAGVVMSDHGSPPWPSMYIYQNTMIVATQQRHVHAGVANSVHPDRPRHVFNNIIVHLQKLPGYPRLDPGSGVQADGNLFWSPSVEPKQQADYFRRYRSRPEYKKSKSVYPSGFGTNSQVADPLFIQLEANHAIENDYRLKSRSPAINAGVPLPKDWPDSLVEVDKGKPDIGALPHGSTMFHVGPETTP